MEKLSLDPGDRLYEVYHVTRYNYAGPVTLSLQSVRLTPRFRRFEQTIETEPGGNLRFVRDAFENPTYNFEYIGETRVLSMTNRMQVVRSPINPFDFLIDSNSLSRPVQYSPTERKALAAYFEPEARKDPVLAEAAKLFFPDDDDTLIFLTGVNANLHAKIDYIPRDEPGIYSPAEILRRRSGSCRDYASLLQKLLQFEGMATRFVSGYLLETGDMQGAEAMHAWTEVYVPGAGWIGFDPTNGVLTDDAFVPCAVAVDPDETTPIGGRYFANKPCASTLGTQLQIRCIAEA